MEYTLTTINDRIQELDGRIAQQRELVIEADIACKAAEFKQKVQENLAIFRGKSAEPKPLSDLTAKSKAISDTEALGDSALLAEATWLRERTKLDKLTDERDTLRARENNIRAEHRMGYGT
jgi:hypothetical protein